MAEVVALITAVVVLATAVTTWRTRRSVQEVHVMVNAQRTALLARLDQLTAALETSDTAVPPTLPAHEDTDRRGP